MNWQMPVFAHIPLIHGSDNAKLSKRHGAQDINTYKEQGYLPTAMRNYLSRLGWAHGDDEIFTTEQAIQWFSLEAVGKSSARFDSVKLDSLNNHYLKNLADEQLLEIFTAQLHLEKNIKYQRFIPVLRLIAERSKTLTEFVENAIFLIEIKNNPSVALDNSGKILISDVIPQLEKTQWDRTNLEGIVRAFAEKKGGLKEVAQAMRIALVGQKNAPSIFDVMVALGREEALKRMRNAL
jgi:glutamyl-tRNA synthetase